MLHQCFEQKHIKEWMHGVGLQNTLEGLEKFFQGKTETTYWIGYDKNIPLAFLITSPEATNTRTLHVYQKVGFKIIGEFIVNWHPVPHYQIELDMKDLFINDSDDMEK